VFTKLKSLLYNNEVRAALFQILAVVVIAYFAYQAFDNMMLNIEQRGISIFLNSRGLYLPRPVEGVEIYLVLASFIIGVVSYIFIKRRSNKKHDDTGIETNTTPYFAGLVLLLPIAVYFASGAQLEYPVLKGFNFRGGVDLSIEFFALAFALSIYTATYIAEAIRSGIESVDNGQKEAAAAMGLTQTQSLRLVVLPQALRVAIPPIINQYLNLTKNSSLAAAVGYTELVTIFSGTVLNVVGQAIEIIILTMLVYLAISLVISLILNIFNKKMQIKGK